MEPDHLADDVDELRARRAIEEVLALEPEGQDLAPRRAQGGFGNASGHGSMMPERAVTFRQVCQDRPAQRSTLPRTQVTASPPIQIVTESSIETWTRPSRPSALPCVTT
jgi:hypothetical protein